MAGGFPLRKWVSNDTDIPKSIPSEHQTFTSAVSINDHSIHTLGVSWNPLLDSFSFDIELPEYKALTKRTVLSQIARFFDPLGFLSPLFIRAKVFMPELWTKNLQWNDPLESTQLHIGRQFIHSLEGYKELAIPRWIGTDSTALVEVHGFCDASQAPMAAVVYIRTVDRQNHISVSLLSSKTKVSPLKRQTIPRLELSAAVILTKLISKCMQILNLYQALCYLWTDSSTVLTWINNHPSKWKEFVHNRVCMIQETLPNATWKHVPGDSNPADCASRGLSAKELKAHAIWWKGPSWLHTDPHTWPQLSTRRHTSPDEDLEKWVTPRLLHVAVESNLWDIINHYSSLIKLYRITAPCLRIVKRFKEKRKSARRSLSLTSATISEVQRCWIKSFPLTQTEISEAQLYWIMQIQQHHFLAEIKCLSMGKELPKASSLRPLIPFLDDRGLLRVYGCLRNALIPSVTRQPYIIPKVSALSNLIIKDAHQRTLHGSTQETLYALFVCFATSAIHLELVTDYSSDAFIAAYKRFTSRRGICATLTSDCGTNFKGASKELKTLFTQSSRELATFISLIANDGTKWNFNPPAAPHFGGKWKAGVKSMKHHLQRIMADTLLTFEEMSTLIAQVKAIFNSRLLCPLTKDPIDSQMMQGFWVKWTKGYLQRH